MKSYYVYIMSNQSNSVLYIGVTNDLIRRVYEHKNKLIDGFTKRYNLNKLVYFECVENVNVAIAREKQLKGWRRSKKDALIRQINSQLEDLSEQIQ
ncbi:MAG: GIY-YIG nuclease family protein [Alphaproteobacteria bacterium]|nr:GIY-YIG nuclease family protein [Alphaproteobacteria bacterium]